jgi:hypothetical protein
MIIAGPGVLTFVPTDVPTVMLFQLVQLNTDVPIVKTSLEFSLHRV